MMTLLLILAIIIVCVIGLILLLDVVPIFCDWYTRIHIGRNLNLESWNNSISKVGIKWLNNSPVIRVTDNTRLVIIDMLKGNYFNNTIQHWQEASLLLGLLEYEKYNKSDGIKTKYHDFLNDRFNEDGHWRNKPQQIDAAILAYAVMKIPNIDLNNYKPAFDDIWFLIQEHIGEDGTVDYRKNMKNYKYVDTIGFICPFLVSYGIRFNNPMCIELAIDQIKQYEQFGMMHDEMIPCHAYKHKDKFPLGLYGWGRGLGWFALGLIDSWNELQQTEQHKTLLNESVVRFAKTIMGLQQEVGNWNWLATLNESRPDSSATATLAWFLIHASKIDDISEDCMNSAVKALQHLMKVTRRTGVVDFSQGDTKGIGVYSMLFNKMPFTQGFSIRCVNYYINLINNKKVPSKKQLVS